MKKKVDIQAQRIICADFREGSVEIPDNSVELIFSDFPPDGAAVPLYEAAAKIGARILKPGGSLITFVPNDSLHKVLPAMSPHLPYKWLLGCGDLGWYTEEQDRPQWKPHAWFVKGEWAGFVKGEWDWVNLKAPSPGRITGGVRDYLFGEAYEYIQYFTTPNGLVVDFFANDGATCIAAQEFGRSASHLKAIQ
jgi:hypothetical protein